MFTVVLCNDAVVPLAELGRGFTNTTEVNECARKAALKMCATGFFQMDGIRDGLDDFTEIELFQMTKLGREVIFIITSTDEENLD